MTDQRISTPEELSPDEVLKLDISAKLSYERTVLSHERTLMSWVRTATSLITFGFTIYKFFEIEQATIMPSRAGHVGARQFAMCMIATGIIALAIGTVQNWHFRTSLRKMKMKVPPSLATVVGALVAGLGFLALASAVFRW